MSHDPDLVARATRTMAAIRTMLCIIMLSSIIGLLCLLYTLLA
jgi:hypothetical protein